VHFTAEARTGGRDENPTYVLAENDERKPLKLRLYKIINK